MSPLTPDYQRPPSETPPPPMLDYSAHDLAWMQEEMVKMRRENAQLRELVRDLEAENRKLRAAVDWHARADGMA